MTSRVMLAMLLVATACGDDGGKRRDDPDGATDDGMIDAPTGDPSVELSVDAATVNAVTGQTVGVLATIVRGGGFTGAVDVAVTGAPTGVTASAGTIAAADTSVGISILADATVASQTFTLTITGTAAGVTIAPASLVVTIAGRIGLGIPGEAAGDQAGTTVAVSADGKRVVIGSPFNDGTGADGGSARVYERGANDTWTQLGGDIDGEAAGDHYGTSIAISNDGTRIAVGGYLNDGGGTNAGHVRVLQLVGTTWTQLGTDIDGTAGSELGFSVALNAAGTRLVAGAPTQNSATGRVFVYDFNGTAWTQVGQTLTNTKEIGDAVDISDDGTRIACGSPSAGGSTLPGTAEVYSLVGTTWTLLGSAITGEAVSDVFGDSVSLSADGNTLAVGASANKDGGISGGGVGAGSVRVYRFAANTWTQLGADLDGPLGGGAGTAVSLSADGTRLLSGGPEGGGATQYFTLTGATWTVAPGPAMGTGQRSGSAVSLSADGHTAAVGAVFAMVPGASQGETRLYDLP